MRKKATMKNVLILFLAVAVVFALTACSKSDAGAPDEGTAGDAAAPADTAEPAENTEPAAKTGAKKIAYLINSSSDTFQVYVMNGAKSYCEANGIELLIADAQDDSGKQLSQVETMCEEGVDAIICVIVDSSGGSGPLYREICDEYNVPLIGVCRYLDEAHVYVSTDPKQAGIIQGQYLAEAMGGKGNLAILLGILGSNDAVIRTDAIKSVLADYPDIKIVFEETGEWQRDQGMTVAENWLQSGTHIDAIAANNDEMAVGAAMAVSDAGMKEDIIVAGIDGNVTALEEMEKGLIDATVYQDAAGQGEQAVISAVKAIEGEYDLNADNWEQIPFELVTPDNCQKYLDAWAEIS